MGVFFIFLMSLSVEKGMGKSKGREKNIYNLGVKYAKCLATQTISNFPP
jgi:hypothetical protein